MRPVHSPKVHHVHVHRLGVDEHEISSSFSFTRLTADGEGDEEREEEEGYVEETDFGELDTSLSLGSRKHKESSSTAEEERLEDDHRDHVTTSATAEQILHLIGQLELTTSGLNRHIAPCPCCTGELTVV